MSSIQEGWTRRRRFWGSALAVIGLLLAVGCGSDGPPRYRLHGNVTRGGQPIAAGSITLIPDSAQGNKGLAVSIPVKAGHYDTDDTECQAAGHVGGPHTVRITGLDGDVSDEFPMGMPLFPEYKTQADLPAETAEKDFEVPADWTMPRSAPVSNHGA